MSIIGEMTDIDVMTDDDGKLGLNYGVPATLAEPGATIRKNGDGGSQ